MASFFNLARTLIVYLICRSLCEGLQKINCNIENSSTVLLSCRSNEQIFIKSIFYHQPTTECQGTGSCRRRVRTDDSNFSPICQYKYGDCNQTLDTTVLNHCKTDNLSIAAEVDYDCRVKQDEHGVYSVQVLDNSNWIADISCPQRTFIYITSIEYWTLDNSTCQSDPLMIREEQLRLNHLCIKQQKCQPPLLYNITTTDGCRLEWPNVGAKLNYMCIEEAVDVCSDVVRTPSDSLASLYLTSPTISSSTSGMPSSCRCQVYGKEMTVKILYLNLPAVSSVRGDLYFTPPSDSPLNLTTPQVNTTIFSNISNVTVMFDNRNIKEHHFLLEFKGTDNSFLQMTCLRSEFDMPISSMFTYTTVAHGGWRETKGPGGTNGVLIGIIVGSIILVIGIIMLIILLLRKRKHRTHKNDINNTYGHSNDGFQEHSYFEVEPVTAPYSLASIHHMNRGSYNGEQSDTLEPNGISKIRVRNKMGEYENIDLNDLLEKDDVEINAQSYSQYADIDEFNHSSLINLKGADVVLPSDHSLCAPTSDKVEYAKVNKLKKRTNNNEVTPNIEIQLNGLPIGEVTAPPIPEKHLTEEEKNAVHIQSKI